MSFPVSKSKFGVRVCPTCKRRCRTTKDVCLWCGKSLTQIVSRTR